MSNRQHLSIVRPAKTAGTGQDVPQPGSGGSQPRAPKQVFWDRRELDALLNVYGRRVAAGDWRDYAMSGLRDVAVFSVYRRASEMPLYRIEKRPKLRNRQGAYAVIAASGMILKRGHELKQVLKVLEPKQLSLVSEL
jgi:hypothetical protein